MNKKNVFTYSTFALIVLLFPFIIGKDSYFLVTMIIVGITVIVTEGLTILIGFAGQLSLAQAAFYGVGAYVSAILSTRFCIAPLFSIIFAVLFTSLLAYVVGIPALKLKGHYLAMVTLGFGEIINIIFKEWGSLTGGPSGMVGIPQLSFFGNKLQSDVEYYFFVWIVVLIITVFLLNIVNSRIGRGLLAIKDYEEAAEALGVPIAKYKIKAFVLSAALGALGGGLYAHYVTVISPETFETANSIILVTMVIAGGATYIWGAIVGTFLFIILPEMLQIFEDYNMLIYGFILLFILMFMPQGVVGIFNFILQKNKNNL